MYAMLAFITCITACGTRDRFDDDRETTMTSFSVERRHTVDSLAGSLSEDTLSLLTWLPLTETTNDSYARSVVYHQLGNYHRNIYAFHRALEYHNLSLEVATMMDENPLIVKSLNAIAKDYKLLGTYDRSAEYYFKALALLNREEEADNKFIDDKFLQIEKMYTLKGLGVLYLGVNQTDEAMKYFMQSLELAKIHKQADAIAANLSNIEKVQESNSQKNYNAISRFRLDYEKERSEAEKGQMLEQFQLKERKVQFALLGNLIIIIALLGFIFVLIQNIRLKKRNGLAMIQLEKLKSDFCARVSQDFTTPAGIIMSLVDRIKNDLTNSEKKQNQVTLDILSRQTKNLYTLTEEVNTIAKLQSTNNSTQATTGNVIAYLQHLYECFALLVESKHVIYTFHSNTSELHTSYAPDYLRAILSNLIESAIRHCVENDQVAVRVKHDKINKNYSLEVAHTGTAVSEEGMAIGLSLAKHLAEKLGGWIESKNMPEGETVFSATFPLNNTVDMTTEKPITIRRAAINSGLPGTHMESRSDEKPIALIVQQNRYLSYYLTTLLQDRFQVVVETNAENVIKLANEKQPHIILSDTKLSRNDTLPPRNDMKSSQNDTKLSHNGTKLSRDDKKSSSENGFDLCEKIKNSEQLFHIPMILLTSTHSREERVKGFEAGADACLEKPLYEDELIAVIDQLISTRKQIRDTYSRIMGVNNTNGDENAVNEDSIDFLQQVTNLIYKEITNTDHIIEKIASEVCLSTSQLNRKIKAITGLTTSHYILKTRLNRAKRQLGSSRKPIGDIAMACGFNDFAYFSRSFKKEFGMTPTTFQRLPESAS